jgi:hypothetical protein
VGVLGRVRKFLNWERRVFLGEEEWEFATVGDMSGLTQALDQRLKRRSTTGKRTVWSSRMRALSVHVTAPDRIEVFWKWGYWSLFPWVIGGLHFDGHLTTASDGDAVVGQFRQPTLSGAFLLLVANFAMLWLLLLAAVLVVRKVGGCFAFGGDGCGTVANGGVFLGFGVLVVSIMLAGIRYVIGGYLFSRQRIRALLTDLAAGAASG